MVCVCPVVRILLIFKIFFPTRNIFCWLNCPAVLGRWWWWKLLGEVTREGAAAEQKSVVLAGAEWGRETWDRCHFVYGLIVKYWELRLVLSIKWYFSKNIFLIFYICTQDLFSTACSLKQDKTNFPYICEHCHCYFYLFELLVILPVCTNTGWWI